MPCHAHVHIMMSIEMPGLLQRQTWILTCTRLHLILHVFFQHDPTDDAFIEKIKDKLSLP